MKITKMEISPVVTDSGYSVNINGIADTEDVKALYEMRELISNGDCSISFTPPPHSSSITFVAYCDEPGKEKVIVGFKDGSKITKYLKKGDTFDLNIGVALAIAEKLYGTNTQFHKMIQKKIVHGKSTKKSKITQDVK